VRESSHRPASATTVPVYSGKADIHSCTSVFALIIVLRRTTVRWYALPTLSNPSRWVLSAWSAPRQTLQTVLCCLRHPVCLPSVYRPAGLRTYWIDARHWLTLCISINFLHLF
jgi:hypothetical protein